MNDFTLKDVLEGPGIRASVSAGEDCEPIGTCYGNAQCLSPDGTDGPMAKYTCRYMIKEAGTVCSPGDGNSGACHNGHCISKVDYPGCKHCSPQDCKGCKEKAHCTQSIICPGQRASEDCTDDQKVAFYGCHHPTKSNGTPCKTIAARDAKCMRGICMAGDRYSQEAPYTDKMSEATQQTMLLPKETEWCLNSKTGQYDICDRQGDECPKVK